MKLLILGIGTQEVLLIAVVALLFFGGKKIPELMSGLGKGVKSFRDSMNGSETTDAAVKPKTADPDEKQN